MSQAFQHKQAAHCETGAISNLLRHHGLALSEPMAFGIASGMTFAYIKFVKINGMPLMAYRMPPRMILRLLAFRVKGLKLRFEKFRSESEGMAALDNRLAQGEVVGLQTSVFFLPYFPKDMRFHFNAHNLLVFAKEGDNYQISDPVFPNAVEADSASLRQARFTRGALAPKGSMYYPVEIPDAIDFEEVIPKALRFTCRVNGRKNPMPFCGINGMNMIAKRVAGLDKENPRFAKLFLGHIVRMQEEIGTGGAGFRFMYAAFLQEASEVFDSQLLLDTSREMTRVGDEWRQFALLAARMNKSRGEQSYHDIADKLQNVAKMELAVYNQLERFKAK